MGPGALDTAILRVLAAPDQPVGLGFLVADGVALSCAHVLATALGIEDDRHSLLGATVPVDLPLSGPGITGVTATVEQWAPEADVVVLRLAESLPGAAPVRLAGAEELWGHPASAYGLPAGRPGGVWHHGVLRHRQANGWVQLDLAGTGYRVSPGFSGGPVWDEVLAGVVGMVVTAESADPPVGYLIPVGGLLTAWPGLRELALPPSPFRGLAHFRESDAAIFRGRQAESAEIAGIVAAGRCTTLVGPSGCGKSSLAMAGVLPLRRAAGDCPVVMRPGQHRDPLHALAAELLPLLEPELPATEQAGKTPVLAGILAEQGLSGILPRILDRHGARRLLVLIDQFEELLERPDEAVDALTRVLFAPDTPAELGVLCTLRADFLEPVLAHPRLGSVAGQRVCAVAPLRPAQYREIVTSAVEHTPGVRYEPGLAERILADTGAEPGALPLLSFTLDLLWHRQHRGLLTHEAYREIGGVGGALEEYAEREWAAKIPAADEPDADRLLTRLVRVPLDAPAATRRIVARAELSEAEWRLAQRLAGTRLLAIGGGQDAEVELAHEALITGWDRLSRRIATDRSFLDWRETVRYEADRWQRGDRPVDLLPGDTALAASARWLPDRAAELGQAELDYLERGRGQQRIRRRGRRILRSVLTLVVAVVVLLAGLFVNAWLRGEEQRTLADSRALTQVSQDNANLDPVQSVLTALAAYQISPTQEARNQLMRHYLAHADADRMFSGLLGKVETFAASRDGRVVLATSDLGRAMLFTQDATGRVRATQVPRGYVKYPVVSVDGRRAGFLTEDRAVAWFLVDPDNEQPMGQLRSLPTPPESQRDSSLRYHSPTLSLDGRLLAAAAGDRLVWWDLEAGAVAGSLPKPWAVTMDMWFGADGRSLLVRDLGEPGGSALTAVELDTGRSRTVLAARKDQTFAVSGDRTALVVCRPLDEKRSELYRVPVAEGAQPGRPYAPPTLSCGGLAVDFSAERIVVRDGNLSYVDLGRGVRLSDVIQPLGAYGHEPQLLEVAGKHLLASKAKNRIFYTELRTHATVLNVLDQEITHDSGRAISLLTNGALQLRTIGAEANRVLAEVPAPPVRSKLRQNNLILSRDGSLIAYREAEDVILVRDSETLRQVSRITTIRPARSANPFAAVLVGDLGQDLLYNYAFDYAGNLVTNSDAQVQQWDPRTARELARFDARPLLPAAVRQDPGSMGVGIYPAANQVALVVRGEPVVKVVDVTTGLVTTTVETVPDLVSIQFDPSGRYVGLLRQGSVVELWSREPRRREIGPLRSLTRAGGSPQWTAGFVNDQGRYVIAANNSVRFYQIGQPGPVDSYEFGEPASLLAERSYNFMGMSRDARTVVYAGPLGRGGPIRLDPAEWSRELCRVIGNRVLTAEDQAALPARVPAQPICPVR